jgi:hypothetical protein
VSHDDPRAFFAEHGWLAGAEAYFPVDGAGRLAEAAFPTVYLAPQ